MDDRKFDELARSLAGVASRRSVLKALSGGALAAAATLIGVGRAGAACLPVTAVCRKHGDCCTNNCAPAAQNRMRCACPAGATLCDGVCKTTTDFASDVQNCGVCDNVCSTSACAPATCVNGICGTAPVVCGPNAACVNGACACTAGPAATCPNGSCCAANQFCNASNVCTGTQDLGTECAASGQCQSNLCCPAGGPRAGLCGLPDGAQCPINAGNPSNNACCSNTCVMDPGGQTATCRPAPGSAGAPCDPGDEADCQEALACCIDNASHTGFACTDVSVSETHCGACNVACDANETCTAGSCGCTGGAAATCDNGSCCPAGEICDINNTCVPPLGTGLTCEESSDCASGLCCPAGTPREGLCGIATGQPCPVNAGSPSNNSCCSGSCRFDTGSTTTATCQPKSALGGPCDVGDAGDCVSGLSCCNGFCRSTTNCTLDTDCCDGICNELTSTCVAAPGLAACAACSEAGDCAGGVCTGGFCQPAQTLPAGWTESASGTADVSIVCGPGTPPLGSTSAQLSVGASGASLAQLRNNQYSGTPLSSLTALSYSTYVQVDGSGGQVPYMNLLIDNDNNGTVDDQLFFEPVYQNGTYSGDPVPNRGNPAVGTWQTWDALVGGWWALSAGTFGPPLVTLASYVAAHPNARIVNSATGLGGVRILAGNGAGAWDDFVGNVDAVTIDTATTSPVVSDF